MFWQQILEWLSGMRDLVLPWFVVREYENAIVLVLGRYNRTTKPGLHWKAPFIAEVLVENVNWDTMDSNFQSLTTKDGMDVVVSSIVKYRVADIRTFIIEVEDARSALSDIVAREIARVVLNTDWNELRTQEVDKEIAIVVRREAKKWGIEIESVTLTNRAKIRTIRLMQGV
jgi:regulator of protease activity HflC (stomatin/prohibitin superfamily)